MADAATPSGIDVIRVWALPDDFFARPTAEQFEAIRTVTAPATPLPGRRKPCRMAAMDEALVVLFFLVSLGLPWMLGLPFIYLLLAGSWTAVVGWLVLYVALATHPMPHSMRTSRLALAMARYLTFEVVLDRNDPDFAVMGTPAVDDHDYQRRHLPALFLGCPHGVFNYGAICWCCFSRWISGWQQRTGAAKVVLSVPGLRYMCPLIWLVPADRASLGATLREPLDFDERRGGTLGMVPDGIMGAFGSRAGLDTLLIGSRRGLMRICAEEGATVYASWFFGTTEHLTVLTDPFGLMERASRRMQAGIMGYYGRFGLPVPRRVAVTLVVAAVKSPKLVAPTAEQLEQLHRDVYVGGLERVYDSLKAYAGYPEQRLVIK